MNSEGMKIVNFRLYCPKCEHYAVKQEDEPCNSCLEESVNQYSEKPVNYKEKET